MLPSPDAMPAQMPPTSAPCVVVQVSAVSAEKMNARLTADRLLQTFLDLVRIPSPSGQEEAVRRYLESRLQQLGLTKQETLSPHKAGYIVDSVGSLIIYIPSNVNSTKTVLMNAHMDVVPPCLKVRPVIRVDRNLPGENRVVYSSGDTVLGADDKSALAPMLEALTDSIQRNLPRPNLILTWTAQEELGAAGAARMDPRWYAVEPFRADVVFSFDISGDQGTVVYQAPQLTLWDAQIQGQSAHAGIEPEKAANALKAAVLAASRVPLGRVDSETTVNIGKIESGEKFNIVPGTAQLSGEVRSFDPARVEQELQNLQKALRDGTAQVPGTSFQWGQETLFEAYKTDLNLPIFEPLKSALKETELELKPIRTTGGSDANVFVRQGIPGVVLSGGFRNPHQASEFVRVQDMLTQARLILNLWQAYAKE